MRHEQNCMHLSRQTQTTPTPGQFAWTQFTKPAHIPIRRKITSVSITAPITLCRGKKRGNLALAWIWVMSWSQGLSENKSVRRFFLHLVSSQGLFYMTIWRLNRPLSHCIRAHRIPAHQAHYSAFSSKLDPEALSPWPMVWPGLEPMGLGVA